MSVQARPRRLLDRIAAVDDGAILRFAFYALLLGTGSMLYIDFRELMNSWGSRLSEPSQPILPPAVEGPTEGPMPSVTTPPETLEQPLEVQLGPGGELRLTGSFDVGSADRFRTEIEARGEYVKTVVLDSPGGSVNDALEIGRLIHEKGLATSVNTGALCASSCPIVFGSGAERIASADAAIGVHQIYAAALSVSPQDALRIAGSAMSDAQTRTAEIMAHLTQTGVDPALWLHALETPPDRLYYFTPQEMIDLRLATRVAED